MAEINFGLIDTQSPARIANALMPSPEQQGAQALQVMQMQQAARQGQVSQMQLQKMKQDAEGVAEFSRRVAKLGGPSDPMEIAQAYLAHPDPEHKKFGLELLRKTQDVAKFTSIMGRRLPGADMSPSVALEPGSFGADVAARRKAELQRTNMLPGAAAAPAGVNAMAAGNAAQIAFKQQQRDDLIGMGTTQSIAAAKAIDADIALLAKEPSYQNVPGVGLVNPRDRSVVMPSVEPTDPIIKQYNFAVSQGFNGTLFDYKREIAKAGRAQAQPVAPTITTVEDPTKPGKFLQVDARVYKGGGAGSPGVIGGAKPSATTEKLAAQRTQMGKDLGFAITQLTDITKDGGLIDQSTGSGAGRLTDIGAGFFGAATPGAIAIGKIGPIADLALKMVPRFEGPQSNADTKSYKEAAGQLADSSLPTKIRKEAGKTVLKIMQARKNQFATADMAAEAATVEGSAPGATGKWGTAVAE